MPGEPVESRHGLATDLEAGHPVTDRLLGVGEEAAQRVPQCLETGELRPSKRVRYSSIGLTDAHPYSPARTIDPVDATTRLLAPDDADAVASAARLLHDFSTPSSTPTPGADALARHLPRVLGDALFVLLADRADAEGPVGIAVVSLRPNVWFDGPVALLDELYVVPPSAAGVWGPVLLAAVRDEARRRGSEYLEINVDEGDTDARRFYEREGLSAVDPDTGEGALYYSAPL